MSWLVGDGESEAQPRVFINRAATILATHPTYWSETWKQEVRKDKQIKTWVEEEDIWVTEISHRIVKQ